VERAVFAVDIGTSSLKAALVAADGRVLASARCRFPRSPRVAADWVAAFREAVAIASRDVCAGRDSRDVVSSRDELHSRDMFSSRAVEIAAISISGNGPTLVSVDDSNTPHEILLWNDPIPEFSSEFGSGLSSGIGSGATSSPAKSAAARSLFIPRIMGYRDLFPASYARARWLFSGPEFLIWHLTGEAVTILPETRFEDAYWTKDALAETGINGAILPPFTDIAKVVGKTTDTGLVPAGIPVVSGGPDFVAALVGTNTLFPGAACDRAGTSEGLNVCTERPVSAEGVRPLPSIIPGLWNAAYLLPTTGADFNAWRRASGQATRAYADIMAEIYASPINDAARDVSRVGDTPARTGREIVERIGFSVRRGIETLERDTGFKPAYALSGGQARNPVWNQMKADITGAEYILTSTPDGELMGDAVMGFAATGDYSSVPEAAKAMVRETRRFSPDPARHALYTEKYLST